MTPEVEAEIRQFVKERDEILMTGDIDRFIAFLKKHNPSGHTFSNREVAEISLHKARTAAKSLPMEYRIKSKKWLSERGHTSMDDKDAQRNNYLLMGYFTCCFIVVFLFWSLMS